MVSLGLKSMVALLQSLAVSVSGVRVVWGHPGRLYRTFPPNFSRKRCGFSSRFIAVQRKASRKQKRSKNWEKAQVQVARVNHKINNTRKDWQLKVAHSLCDGADSIFVEDIDYRVMAKGFLGKHTLDASFGEGASPGDTRGVYAARQFRELLKWVCWCIGKFFVQVDHKGTSKQCPECGTEWDNNLSIRWHTCDECGYSNNRDVASAEVICNRGINKLALSQAEMYPRTIGECYGLLTAYCRGSCT